MLRVVVVLLDIHMRGGSVDQRADTGGELTIDLTLENRITVFVKIHRW